MEKQLSMSALSDELQQVRTKKKEFLAEIDRIVPWREWINLIQPHYYKGERGNKPYDLELMLRSTPLATSNPTLRVMEARRSLIAKIVSLIPISVG